LSQHFSLLGRLLLFAVTPLVNLMSEKPVLHAQIVAVAMAFVIFLNIIQSALLIVLLLVATLFVHQAKMLTTVPWIVIRDMHHVAMEFVILEKPTRAVFTIVMV